MGMLGPIDEVEHIFTAGQTEPKWRTTSVQKVAEEFARKAIYQKRSSGYVTLERNTYIPEQVTTMARRWRRWAQRCEYLRQSLGA
jgi:hypothetical protein